MRYLIPILLVLGAYAASPLFMPVHETRAGSLAADGQQRLDTLFSALAGAATAEEAKGIQAEILRLLTEPPAGVPEMATLFQAADEHLKLAEFDRALAVLDRAVALAPTYPEAWHRRALARFRAGQLDGSVADLARVLALEPRHFGALSGLGLVNLSLGRMEAALQAYEAALKIHPHYRAARVHADAIRQARAGQPL